MQQTNCPTPSNSKLALPKRHHWEATTTGYGLLCGVGEKVAHWWWSFLSRCFPGNPSLVGGVAAP